MKLEPRDIIGGITIIGGFTLMAMHIDHVVGGLVATVVLYYLMKVLV